MGKHLVLVGGGHAHLTALIQADEFIRQGHRVTLIGPSEYHYYSGMGPGLLSGIYRPEEVRFHIRKAATARGVVFVQDRVVEQRPPILAQFAVGRLRLNKGARPMPGGGDDKLIGLIIGGQIKRRAIHAARQRKRQQQNAAMPCTVRQIAENVRYGR